MNALASDSATLPSDASLNLNAKHNLRRRNKRNLASTDTIQSVLPFGRIVLLLTLCCWCGTLGYAHYKLSLAEMTGQQERFSASRRLFSEEPEELVLDPSQQEILERTDHRFLIFEGDRLGGQGAGNLMNGLLATHLLAEEYDRIVCVIPEYDFHMAFELIDPLHHLMCQKFFEEHSTVDGLEDRIELINYMNAPDECELQQTLSSQERKVLYIQANTYPRWRSVPPQYFFRFYRPTQQLVDSLPYSIDHPPSTVVHLRLEDGRGDIRKGLDKDSLDALGALLSADAHSNADRPYLVTNHVAWFDYFGAKYGWKHPNYEIVTHSAMRKKWGDRTDARRDVGKYPENTREKDIQKMQLWADWFSLLFAKKVYHTHSDFSLSAIHWMGSDEPDQHDKITWSRTIMGVNKESKELILEKEAFNTDQTMKKLVDRKGEEIANCRKASSSWKTNNRMNLDVSSKTTQVFLAKSLSIDVERMEEYRQRMKEHEATSEGKLHALELARKVTETIAKHQQSLEKEQDRANS